MKKLSKIVLLTFALVIVMAVPCFAEDVATDPERNGLTGVFESILGWAMENPESVFAAVVTGVSGGFCLGGGVSNRKTRKKIEKDSTGITSAATTINNNAVELATKVKTEVVNMIGTVEKAVVKILSAIMEKTDEIIAAIKENAEETRALRREVKANSFLIRELVKDSRMTQKRKDDIEAGYNDIMIGGEPANDEHDQA